MYSQNAKGTKQPRTCRNLQSYSLCPVPAFHSGSVVTESSSLLPKELQPSPAATVSLCTQADACHRLDEVLEQCHELSISLSRSLSLSLWELRERAELQPQLWCRPAGQEGWQAGGRSGRGSEPRYRLPQVGLAGCRAGCQTALCGSVTAKDAIASRCCSSQLPLGRASC